MGKVETPDSPDKYKMGRKMYEDGQNSLNFSRLKNSAHFLPVMGYRGYEIGAVT